MYKLTLNIKNNTPDSLISKDYLAAIHDLEFSYQEFEEYNDFQINGFFLEKLN